MDAILTKGASTGETRLVNQCRLFLQFQRLFDICNGAGTKIRRDALSSTLCSTACTNSSLLWPRQGTPSAKAWLTWRRVMRRTFLTTLRAHSDRTNYADHWETGRHRLLIKTRHGSTTTTRSVMQRTNAFSTTHTGNFLEFLADGMESPSLPPIPTNALNYRQLHHQQQLLPAQ